VPSDRSDRRPTHGFASIGEFRASRPGARHTLRNEYEVTLSEGRHLAALLGRDKKERAGHLEPQGMRRARRYVSATVTA
jgi:hypothetical protein